MIKIKGLQAKQQMDITEVDFTELSFIEEIMNTIPKIVPEQGRPRKRIWSGSGIQIIQKYEYWYSKTHSKSFALKMSSTVIKKLNKQDLAL